MPRRFRRATDNVVAEIRDVFDDAPLRGFYDSEAKLHRFLFRRFRAQFGLEAQRRGDAAFGPDRRDWKPDFVVWGDGAKIAIELKLFMTELQTLSNYHSELARGLGQCLIYAHDYDAVVLLIVHQGAMRPRRLRGHGFSDEGLRPILLRMPETLRYLDRPFRWIYGFDRWHQIQ